MKLKNLTIILLAFSLILLSEACTKDDDDDDDKKETKISKHNGDDSHNSGQNCMNCHKSGGDGEGWFNIAGTVYDSLKTNILPNATVKLYSGPNGTGTLKYTIEVDGKGNFYTTEDVDFSASLYPSVQGSSITKNMVSAISTGQCNSCHGNSTAKIWTK